MPETFSAHVLSPATQVPDGSETSAACSLGDTVIPVEQADDFFEGSCVQIDGEVYAYDESLIDDGEESGQATVTLSAPLVADVDAGTPVYSWNPNAKGGAGEVNSDWLVQVAPDGETDGHLATLLHTLIPMTSDAMPVQVGDAVTVQADDDGSWTVVNIEGAQPGYDPQFIRTGTIQADVQITVGDPGAQRVVIKGTPAIELYNAANEQTGNLDGEGNYLLGSFATGKTGDPHVEIGSGALGSEPTEEARFYSGSPDEDVPATVRSLVDEPAPGVTRGILAVEAARWDSEVGDGASLRLYSSAAGGDAEIVANIFTVTGISAAFDGSVTVADSLEIGSLGANLQDLIDARVALGGGGGGSSRKTFAFFMGA